MTGTTFSMSALELLLADLIAGQLAGATVHLFVNDVDPGMNAVVGDFTEATFVGSTALPVTAWGQVFRVGTNRIEVLGPLMQWNYASGATEIVYGIYLLSAGVGTPFLGYARLDEAKSMATTDESLAVVPRIGMGPFDWGAFAEL